MKGLIGALMSLFFTKRDQRQREMNVFCLSLFLKARPLIDGLRVFEFTVLIEVSK
jgi:hypothetical protein